MITKENVNEYISINKLSEPYMFKDQMYVSYPCVFPIVNLELNDTIELNKLADMLREMQGYTPCFNGKNTDSEGWYDFTVDLLGAHEGYPENHIAPSIMFKLSDSCGSEAKDKGEEHHLYFSDEVRKVIYDCLNEQCKEAFGQTADELIEECEREVVWD